jgi:polyisoprenoid-binding protein YceI
MRFPLMWRYAVSGALMFGCLATARAQDQGLCAPFKDGDVAPERVQAMLTAARDGHLYRIRNSASRVGFCVDSKLAQIKAEFRTFQGGITLWPSAGKQEQAMILIRAKSLDAGNGVTEHLLKGKDFFDVEHYPEILFVSTEIHWDGTKQAELKGNLTLHGVTRPVTLQVHLTSIEREDGGHVDKVVARAGTVINRSDFGMGALSKLVDEQVRLCLTVEGDRYESLPDAARKDIALRTAEK